MKPLVTACRSNLSLLLCLTLLFSGCAFMELKKEAAEIEKTYAIAGKVTLPSAPRGSVVVLLYSQKEGTHEIAKYTIAAGTGHFTFLLSKGIYYLAAFEDLNHNLMHDPEELAGYFGKPDPISMPPKGRASEGKNELLNLDFRLEPTDRFPSGFPAAVDAHRISRSVNIKFGEITTLDDKRFAHENGSTGYWAPLTFLRDFGFGVYFLEPYDPKKIPVLFVHGALGSPEGWKTMVERLDRKKFQPWFYYYPSGLRLKKNATALNEIIKRLHRTYSFNSLYVTAQSIGGLMARAFIIKNVHEDKQDYIKLFVSISTPWNGHRLTAKGVEGAPAAIPSWYDLVPESEFIQDLFKNKFPVALKYYLLFSYRGDCSLLLKNNDGTVELSSELDHRAQDEAVKVIGFDEDHGSIVYSPKFIDYYNRILGENKSK